MDFGGRKIEASDIPDLDEFDKSIIQTSLCNAFDKMQPRQGGEILLHAHFKKHESEGKRAKYTVHLKLATPGKTFVASEFGWKPIDVLQKTIKALEREATESRQKRGEGQPVWKKKH